MHPCPFCRGRSLFDSEKSQRFCTECGFTVTGNEQSVNRVWNGLKTNTRVGSLKEHIRKLIHQPHAKVGVSIKHKGEE